MNLKIYNFFEIFLILLGALFVPITGIFYWVWVELDKSLELMLWFLFVYVPLPVGIVLGVLMVFFSNHKAAFYKALIWSYISIYSLIAITVYIL